MKICRIMPHLMLAALLILPSMANSSSVQLPALDIQDLTAGVGGPLDGLDDLGATITATTFDIDATAFKIITGGTPVDIPNETFTLTSTGSGGVFNGSFSVGGGLLTGSFNNLLVMDLGDGFFTVDGNVTYSGGTLMGGLSGGHINGAIVNGSVAIKLGEVTVVPVPAAVWLFGSGLIGLIGVARRKAS